MGEHQPSCPDKHFWATVRFPNWNNVIHVVETKEITCVLVKSKWVYWKPENILDFDKNLPYFCVTPIDSIDGDVHNYCIQIYRISGNIAT